MWQCVIIWLLTDGIKHKLCVFLGVRLTTVTNLDPSALESSHSFHCTLAGLTVQWRIPMCSAEIRLQTARCPMIWSLVQGTRRDTILEGPQMFRSSAVDATAQQTPARPRSRIASVASLHLYRSQPARTLSPATPLIHDENSPHNYIRANEDSLHQHSGWATASFKTWVSTCSANSGRRFPGNSGCPSAVDPSR